MRYCPFLPYLQGEPSECLNDQCMLWSERTQGCSLAVQQATEFRSPPAPSVRQAQQTTEERTEPKTSTCEPGSSGASGFDRWFLKVKAGSDDPAQECVPEEDPAEETYEETEEPEDATVEEQLADGEQITCAGCGRQLPKGALWCPKCNESPR